MKKRFDDREQELKDILSKCNSLIEQLPEGRLKVIQKQGRPYYYICDDKGDKSYKYLHRDEINTARKIAQRDYEQKVKTAVQKEMTAITKYSKTMPETTYEHIYDKLVSGRKILVTPHFVPDNVFLEKWLAEPYESGYFEDGMPEHYTDNNERVRSKSEVIIANTLNKLGIPYKYECPIFIGNKKVYPDFSILKMPQRKVIYWEHLGLLDDDEYLARNMEKLDNYESHGYFLGDNLIITRETSERPLNSKHVMRLIEHYLL
ncbi:hypothetical protein [Butyrivibrio sp. JL13D10]|uniref:hypothetical protein n=1 Tax=Butyrivibrio sp. JL13D10 TaxID=3236815 RepID=UPI0038B5D906